MADTSPPEKRFWKYVNKTDNCWIWIGGKGGSGHGTFHIGQKEGKNIRVGAHVYSLYLETGKWPELYVLHKCNNRPCVNPAHLYEGTQSENLSGVRRRRGRR